MVVSKSGILVSMSRSMMPLLRWTAPATCPAAHSLSSRVSTSTCACPDSRIFRYAGKSISFTWALASLTSLRNPGLCAMIGDSRIQGECTLLHVGHDGRPSQQTRIHRQRTAMMCGVLDDRPHDVTHRLTAHHGTGRQWRGKLLRRGRLHELDRAGESLVEPLTRLSQRRDAVDQLPDLCEIEVEAFGPGDAFHKPIESMRRVRHLLRDSPSSRLRRKPRVRLLQDAG